MVVKYLFQFSEATAKGTRAFHELKCEFVDLKVKMTMDTRDVCSRRFIHMLQLQAVYI